ncbi:MAG: PfkB family carbohydrate kinase [Acidobacteriota bacterium]
MHALMMATGEKVKPLAELAEIVTRLKAAGKKIVHTHGVFDLLHIGHIRHFEQARSMGDVLIVTLTQDVHVNKGPHRPAFPQDLRAEILAALSVVDYVAVNQWPLSVETIRLLKPDVYVKGPDYRVAEQDITGGIVLEGDAVRAVGGELRFTDDITFSSSTLVNRFLSPFEPEVNEFLEGFRRKYSIDYVLDWLDRASTLKPIVVGEAIIDEYIFCDALGKSSKDPLLAVLMESETSQAGGSLSIANHLAGLCGEVGLITMLGDRERREDFVTQSLKPNVNQTLITKVGAPTIHKRRMVDRYSGNKLFEIYVMDDRLAAGEDAAALEATLRKQLDAWDVAIVADYGHGMMTPAAVDILCTQAPFLAVNVQSNAGNRGFNPVSKYRRADYVSLAVHEINMETRDRVRNLREQLLEVAGRVSCDRFTVTRGKLGSLHYNPPDTWVEVPALATRVLDRVGAGDAVLAVTSLLVKLGAPWDVVGFIGNVAGAELVAELGNRVPLNKIALAKHITALMK